MKPHRIVMAHHLVLGYGLQKRMDVFVSVFFCWGVTCVCIEQSARLGPAWHASDGC